MTSRAFYPAKNLLALPRIWLSERLNLIDASKSLARRDGFDWTVVDSVSEEMW